MNVTKLILCLLAVWFILLPIAVLVAASILGDASALYRELGVWGIAIFLACPVVVAVGGFLLDDGRPHV